MVNSVHIFMNFCKRLHIGIFVILGFFFLNAPFVVYGGVVDSLREEINARTKEVKKLEEEIKEYKNEINRVGGQAKTLNSAIRTLKVTDKKLSTDIQITEKKITRTALTIDALRIEISDKVVGVKRNITVLAQAIRDLHELESRSLVEIILSNNSFSGFWKNVESLEQFQDRIRDKVGVLRNLKEEFELKKTLSENEKKSFLGYKKRLAAQKIIVKGNKSEKERLLRDTRNKESNYKKILKERLAQKKALEQEINKFEARIRVEIDPENLPPTGTGILSWPLKVMSITQYFGNTPFASKNPQVYNGSGHNGVDLRASVGTPVHASTNGTVVDTGDTDKQCYKVSYGKWVLIRHYNGLSTLYAHLSQISVTPGQSMATGDVLGYSGNSGYTTGPHLHFTAFVSKAVRVTSEYKSKVCGTYLKLPLSSKNGYLNPLSYLVNINK